MPKIDYRIFKVTPMGKPRMTRRDKWDKRPAVTRYWAYKEAIQYQRRGFILPDTFTVIFDIPMPKSWSKTKRAEMAGQPHQQKPDFDNLLKGLVDALRKEDESIYCALVLKRWADEGAVKVWPGIDTSRFDLKNSTFQYEKIDVSR